MIAIRGATTIDVDSEIEIKEKVSELLNEIVKRNELNLEDIVCIMFSTTSDIHSYYPAKAARETGFFSCALYSSIEPEIFGALKKCIRVMVLCEIERQAVHVYLRGAINLRKDISKKINIAIDGPAGSGKSTVSKIIAQKLGILYLDTGAMYRACAYACIESNINYKNENEVNDLMKKIKLSVKYENDTQVTMINGTDVSSKIRTPEISMTASVVSSYSVVRVKLVEAQREIANLNSCILDGRDIGTNVLPNAEFKFFLTATPEVRADRRCKELSANGIIQSYESVLSEIIQRDNQDCTRKVAPLTKAEDAVEINTGTLTAEEVANLILKIIQGRI